MLVKLAAQFRHVDVPNVSVVPRRTRLVCVITGYKRGERILEYSSDQALDAASVRAL
jgi:hypothetical protein